MLPIVSFLTVSVSFRPPKAKKLPICVTAERFQFTNIEKYCLIYNCRHFSADSISSERGFDIGGNATVSEILDEKESMVA